MGISDWSSDVCSSDLYQFDVLAANGALPPSEEGRLQGWLDAIGVGYGDRIAIEDPSTYGRAEAQATTRAMIECRGLLLSGAAPATTGHAPGEHHIGTASCRETGVQYRYISGVHGT